MYYGIVPEAERINADRVKHFPRGPPPTELLQVSFISRPLGFATPGVFVSEVREFSEMVNGNIPRCSETGRRLVHSALDNCFVDRLMEGQQMVHFMLITDQATFRLFSFIAADSSKLQSKETPIIFVYFPRVIDLECLPGVVQFVYKVNIRVKSISV